ncbi:glycosyltransferase family 9 protein [Lentimicrobium sp.]|uniref:glycosyltransferase family 9 protein n=1 Tax=Lentimicrobium sp. TaxID=2034841 RepID=UPI00345E3C4F
MLKKILIIQTASIGDVILSTALAETLHRDAPNSEISYLVRKGYESLFLGHPFVNQVLVWDKKGWKYLNLLKLILKIRRIRFDAVINVQRFASSGFVTALSGAAIRSGFGKNPLSSCFTKKSEHRIEKPENSEHEIDRNHRLIDHLVRGHPARPRLYPSEQDIETARHWAKGKFITISPASLWFTKQYPEHKWVELTNNIPAGIAVILLGSAADTGLCAGIAGKSVRDDIVNLAGRLTLLQSASLMQYAIMNYVNDSAPQHLASAVNAPVAGVFCSTVPAFGFGPLSDTSFIIEAEPGPPCRPCGLHGLKKCPLGHFDCAETIQTKQLLNILPSDDE